MQLLNVHSTSQTQYADSTSNKRWLMFNANKKKKEKGKRIEFKKEDTFFALCSLPQDIFSHLFNQTTKLQSAYKGRDSCVLSKY